MIRVDVRHDLARLRVDLDDVGRRQLPFAAANALNDVARLAVDDWREAAPKIFNNPVPFTLNAVYANTRATKRSLEASVAIRFSAPKGTAAEKYLAPEIEGGERRLKRFERRLAGSAMIPGNAQQQTIPARGAKMDAFGNMQRAQLNALLGHLRAFGDTGQNVSDRALKRLQKQGLVFRDKLGLTQYFVAKSRKDGKPLGVYQLVEKGRVEPVLLFARRKPKYGRRLDFNGLMTASYRRNFAARLEVRLAEARATARR